MNKKLYIASAALLTLAACDYNDKYFDGLDEIVAESQKVVTSVDYTLTEADYSTISKYSAVDAADAAELSGLAKAQSFSSTDFAARYIPTLLASKYPTVDNGSAVKVTYNQNKELPEYLGQIAAATTYTLSDADYENVWGNAKTKNLTPKTSSKLSSLVKSGIADAASGDYAFVSYQYSDNEPSTEENASTTLIPITIANTPAGNDWNYINTGAIDLSAFKGQKIRLGFRYTSTEASAGTVEFKNLQVAQYFDAYVFAKQEDGSFKLNTKGVSEAGEYVLAAHMADGYIPFGKLADATKTYGYCKGDALAATDNIFSAESVADYVVTLEIVDGGYKIKADGKYFYMKGTYDSFNVAAEIPEDGLGVWTVSTNANGTISIVNAGNSKTIKYDTNYKSFGAYDATKCEAAVYMDNTLLSADNVADFSIVNIVVGSGLTTVWSHDTKYGYKGTGYNNGNFEADSYIITSEIDLSSATVPCVTFDLAGNKYGEGAVTSDYFNLYATVDYTEGADFIVDGNAVVTIDESVVTKYALLQYNGSEWSTTDGVFVINPADYTAMGLSNANFSSSANPDNYIPKYLAANKPYALEDDVVAVVYHYYDSSTKETSLCVDEYTYTEGVWVKTITTEAVTSQFVKTNGAFTFDPSVVINLPKASTSAYFYQACTDWVWENIDTPLGFTTKGQGYVTSYANNEYYTGSTAYQNNVDWRVAKAREQYAAGYEGLSDDEALALMQDHLKEAWAATLSVLYPDAKPIEGIDVTYTINFIVYGLDQTDWTVAFKLVGVGQFEYVEGSLKAVE